MCSSDLHLFPGDLLSALPAGARYDVILSNPPYEPSGLVDTQAPEFAAEPRLAHDGGRDGLDLIRRLLRQARFTVSVPEPRLLPPDEGLEIAFAGRSNAGKSTAINTLCNQKRLAFSSRTPGRTQHINYFTVAPVKATDPLGFLVDLPGYGYAEVSGSAKYHWQGLLSDYVQSRTQDRKSTRLNSSHVKRSRMPSSA